MTPTQRSLNRCRETGGIAAVVERWNPHAMIRQDLFGFADILWVIGDLCYLVQTTTQSNVSARLAKVRACPAAHAWVASPTRRIEVHGWAKRGPRGKRKTWQLTITDPFAVEKTAHHD